MRRGVARIGGGLAIGLSVLLLFLVTLSDVAVNALNLWTIVLCGLGGVLARQMKLGRAALLLVVGAVPALIGGVGFLYAPSLILIGIAAVLPRRVAATST